MDLGFEMNAPRPKLCLPGFEHVRRFWDAPRERFVAKILPGQFYVTQHEEAIATILGSCVSVCVRDPVAGIGGMNHFLLPHASEGHTAHDEVVNDEPNARYGIHAMDLLINSLVQRGARRHNLEIKMTGGGRIITSMTDIGKHNADFVREYLAMKQLSLLSEDVGDIYARKVLYFPESGRLLVKKLTDQSSHVGRREDKYLHKVEQSIG